ncbi:hypothetical protein [Sphingomonas montana]|uniref:hypothetical protein n=1 Tax=Sphingomonas montana TaxID=1843236 RepID=UPI00096C1A92|nr:hypothetical protein [Sphingomonas montana]
MDRSRRIGQGRTVSFRSNRPLPPDDLTLAVATLRRGTRFLGAGLHFVATDAGDCEAAGRGRAKVIANGLREIDRFLSLLIDAVALRVASDSDRAALHRLGNTARKLATLRAVMALTSPDDAALRAIGRSRNCLFHTGGVVRAGRAGSVPTQGWAAPDAPPLPAGVPSVPMPVGSRIGVSPDDLRRVCLFYDRIADELLAALAARPPSIDFSRHSDYMKSAHVACDGI